MGIADAGKGSGGATGFSSGAQIGIQSRKMDIQEKEMARNNAVTTYTAQKEQIKDNALKTYKAIQDRQAAFLVQHEKNVGNEGGMTPTQFAAKNVEFETQKKLAEAQTNRNIDLFEQSSAPGVQMGYFDKGDIGNFRQSITPIFQGLTRQEQANVDALDEGAKETAKGEAKGLTKTFYKEGEFKSVRATDKEGLDKLLAEGWSERTASDVSGEESALTKSLGKAIGKQMVENRETAIKATDAIRTASEAMTLLDEGVITGFGANFIVNMGRAAKRLGFDVGTNIENTQAFAANQGKAVLDILGSGALGSGTGISDNDRLFAKQIAAGDISLDEKAIRRIITLNAKVSANVIDRHNKEADKIRDKSPISLRVEKPEFKQAMPAPKTQKEFDDLPSGAEYISTDGKRYRKQ